MKYSLTKSGKYDTKSQYADIKKTLAAVPVLSMPSRLGPHKKQLAEIPAIIYHRQTKQLLSRKVFNNPEEKKLFVSERVAKILWTNFCLQGHDTPMLRHLHSALRTEYGSDLQFNYSPKNIEFSIMRKADNHAKPVSHAEQITLINRAWQISQEVVSKYTQ